MGFVSISVIKSHLNIDAEYTGDDNYLCALEAAAENAVEIHIGRRLVDLVDSYSGALPAALVHAILLLIGTWYMNRESIGSSSMKELPHCYDYLVEMFKSYSYYG